ncbi:MAG: response regulator [Actinomycetota bacterium]
MTPIRLILADDHPLMLQAMESILTAEPDFRVEYACRDGQQALEAVRRLQPDILLLDLKMPGMDGLAVLAELHRESSLTRTVIYTATMHQDDVLTAVRLGVRGMILKDMSADQLLRCLRKVHAGETWIEKRSIGLALDKILRRETEMYQISAILTPRELDLVRMVASGLANRQIAEKAHITEGTVKVHLHRIYAKLDLRDRMALTLFARDRGLV